MNLGPLDKDGWLEIVSSLRRHKIRTAVTAFGVFWGILMLILLLAAGRGLENGVYSHFSGVVVNSVTVFPGRTVHAYKGQQAGRELVFTNDDVEAVARISEVEGVAPRALLPGEALLEANGRTASYSVSGVTPYHTSVRKMRVTKGRFLNESDCEQRRKVAVIGSRIASDLFPNQDPLGCFFSVKGVFFMVIGVIDDPRLQVGEASMRFNVYTPLPTLQECFGLRNAITSIVALVKEGVPAIEVEWKITRLLGELHNVDPVDLRKAINAFNSEEEYMTFQRLFRAIRVFIWLIGGATLCGGVVGVGHVMIIGVQERTTEIAIRRALGATPAHVVSAILKEALLVTMVAGGIGLVSMLIMAEGKGHHFDHGE